MDNVLETKEFFIVPSNLTKQFLGNYPNSKKAEKLALMRPGLLDPAQGRNLNKVFDYVMLHYDKKITLNTISSLVYMTPNAFCRSKVTWRYANQPSSNLPSYFSIKLFGA